MKNIEGIIFDLDGTLLDTSYDCATAVNLTLEYFGYPTHPVKTIASFLNNGASKLIERALPENCRDKENVSKVLEKYLPLYAEHIYEKTVPYDGIMSFLKKAKEKNIKLGIVTNKPDPLAKTLVEKCFEKGTFEYVSGTVPGIPIKPDAHCVQTALRHMNISAENTVFVGDSYVDVLTAKNAGLFCIGVLWGFSGEKSFLEYAPDVEVRNTKELEDVIFDTNKAE